MNFSSALRYPFQNFAKVMSIVLVLTIAFAVFIAMILNSHDWTPLLAHLDGLHLDGLVEVPEHNEDTLQPLGGATIIGILGLLLVAIASGFWLSGYSIAVIRSVMRADKWMPAVDLTQNIQDGAMLFLSSVAYWLLFLLLFIGLVVLNGLLGQIGVLSGLLVMASLVITVAATLVMGWAYFVGMARFALEGDHRASWQVRQNLSIARANWRKGLWLLLYMIALSILYGSVRGIVDGVFGGIITGNLLASITLSIIIYYIFNLMQHFSTQVLITQYAAEIGIRSDNYDAEKDKVDAV